MDHCPVPNDHWLHPLSCWIRSIPSLSAASHPDHPAPSWWADRMAIVTCGDPEWINALLTVSPDYLSFALTTTITSASLHPYLAANLMAAILSPSPALRLVEVWHEYHPWSYAMLQWLIAFGVPRTWWPPDIDARYRATIIQRPYGWRFDDAWVQAWARTPDSPPLTMTWVHDGWHGMQSRALAATCAAAIRQWPKPSQAQCAGYIITWAKDTVQIARRATPTDALILSRDVFPDWIDDLRTWLATSPSRPSRAMVAGQPSATDEREVPIP